MRKLPASGELALRCNFRLVKVHCLQSPKSRSEFGRFAFLER